MKGCHQCGSPWTKPGTPGFDENCIKCGAPLHACKNCRHFDASRAWNWCKSLSADLPRESDIKNDCEEYEMKEVVAPEDDRRKQRTKDAFDRLFGK